MFIVILALAAVAVGMVLIAGATTSSQAWDEASRLARLTLKQARRIVILVLGVTLLIVGIIMIVAPGPAILVIPLGLAVLASEFVWARRLLVRYKAYADGVVRKAPWLPKPWMIGVVISATIIGAVVALIMTDWHPRLVISVTSSLLIMEGVTMYLVITTARQLPVKNQPSEVPPAQNP